MFDSFSRSFGSTSSLADVDVPSTSDPYFGGIASYQVCGCCGRYHGATDGTDGGAQGVIHDGDDRGSFGPNGKPSYDIIDAGGQITRTGLSWAPGPGQPAVVTYAFRASAPSMPTDTSGFSQFNSFQIAATQLALAAWSDVANITFVQVTDAGSQYSNNATILFGNYSSGQQGAAAFAYLPGSTAAAANPGDVWINSSLSYNATPTLLGYGQQVLVHEIGHAIGLSHPAAYNASANGVITYGADAIYFEDSRQYTVMSYFSERETGADFRDASGNPRYSAVPLLDDIAAAQRLYGANMNTRTGDTVYGFNSNAGQPWFNANNALSPLIFAVWDAGGTDTFDFSGYSVAQTIDLRQGAFSSVGGLVGNVAIALGVVIENVIGGTGADTIRGNSANNVITSNGGNDEIDGGLGSDTVVFSGARSNYTITWNGQVGTITGMGQTVTVSNVEFLKFSDQTIAAAPTGGLLVGGDATDETIAGTSFADTIGGLGGNDVINGLGGADVLDGGSGDDVLNGGDGNDILIGGRGNDALNGGAGHDVADYSEAGAGVTVNLATGQASGGAGADTLSGIEEVRGSVHADILTGDANANILRGGGGIDTLNGGGGNDQLFAGAPGEGGGAPDVIKEGATANNTIGTAVSLNGSFDLATRPDVANSSTIPHATVVATAHGGMEYYAFTVVAGDTVVFDIDNASFDSVLRLFNAGGTQLAQNDDLANDGGSPTDSGLTYTFSSAGTYYVQVSRWQSGADATLVTAPPPAGGTYTLHVSVPSAAVVPLVYLGATLNGEAGDDELNGGSGRDTLNGGSGDDLLIGGGDNDTINGGDGTDTAVFSGNRAAYTISTSGGVTTITGPDGTDTLTNVERLKFANGLFDITGAPISSGPINGTAGADTLNGTSGDDVINGLGGDDVLSGLAGNDVLDGGSGDDVLDGGPGQDTLIGGSGNDTVSYASSTTGVEVYLANGVSWDGTSVDTLSSIENVIGSAYGDYLAGDAGANRLDGGAGDDVLEGGAGNDILIGGLTGLDHLRGGDGNDTVSYAGHGSGVEIYLDTGVSWDGVTMDFLSSIENAIGTDHGDFIRGTSGANRLEGGAGDDVLEGGAGSDLLMGGLTGLDHLRGGDGNDTVSYAGHGSGVQIYLDTGGSWDGVTMDFLSSIENAIGSDHADFIRGTSGSNRLEGGAGDDVLEGGAGNDILIGGLTGLDHLRGGDGNDTVSYAGHGSGVEIYLDTGASWDGVTMDFLSSIENAIGSSHADYIVGSDVANRLEGGAGNDVLDGGAGDDILDGGSGMDVLRGGAGSDTVTYASSATGVEIYLDNQVTWDGSNVDLLNSIENAVGSAHADYIVGSDAANVLDGGAGDDQIAGMGGNDTINGGAGTDVVILRGLLSDYTITAEGGSFRVTDSVNGRDGSDLLTGVEFLRFADGTTFNLAAASPQVIPGLAEDKVIDAQVLPGLWAEKDAAPQTLPSEDDASPAPEVLPALPGADAKGETIPLVLPADDAFILDGKFADAPLVLPADHDEGPLVLPLEPGAEVDRMLRLIDDHAFLHGDNDSLTLLDNSAIPAPAPSHDPWG